MRPIAQVARRDEFACVRRRLSVWLSANASPPGQRSAAQSCRLRRSPAASAPRRRRAQRNRKRKSSERRTCCATLSLAHDEACCACALTSRWQINGGRFTFVRQLCFAAAYNTRLSTCRTELPASCLQL